MQEAINTDVRIKVPDSPLIFETTGDFVEKDDGSYDVLRLECVHYGGKLLVFGDVPVTIEAELGAKHYEATRALLSKTVDPDGGPCYITGAIMNVVNRRGAVRTQCHENGCFQRGNNHGLADATTYDVSLTGIGFNVKDEALRQLDVGDDCSISLNAQGSIIKVDGRVARITPSEAEGHSNVGFFVPQPSRQFINFVMAVQRRVLQKKLGKDNSEDKNVNHIKGKDKPDTGRFGGKR